MRKMISLMMGSLVAAGAMMAEEGFTPIFDGKSLKGWKSSKDNPAAFSVEEGGVLKVTGDRAHLFYVGEQGDAGFRDFELKLKAKTTAGSNSGVYFATQYQEEGWPSAGYEAQVNSSQSDKKRSGSLYGVVNLWVESDLDQAPYVEMKDGAVNMVIKEAVTKDEEWFDYHIIVKGSQITLKINGEKTVEYTEPEGWNGPNDSMRGRKLAKGTIAFQAHDPKSTVFYKDIQLKITK
ncbi:MAG: 3-keto-disaccharide hydrolase [Verrucomicrobiaceae bacterium]